MGLRDLRPHRAAPSPLPSESTPALGSGPIAGAARRHSRAPAGPASYCVQFSARTLINGPLADWTERVHFEGGRQFADADADRIEARKAREARKRTPTKAKAKPPKAKVEPPTPMLSEARQQAVKERVARRKLDVERSRLDPESANREIAEAWHARGVDREWIHHSAPWPTCNLRPSVTSLAGVSQSTGSRYRCHGLHLSVRVSER